MHVDAPVLLGALREYARAIPAGPKDGELLLVGRRELRSNNSWLHNLPSLVRGRPVLALRSSRRRAARGIADGAVAWLESRVHAGPVPIKLSTEMRRGVVSLPHGYGHQAIGVHQATAGSHAGVSVNDWTDDADVERVVGQSILNGVPVRLGQVPSTAWAVRPPGAGAGAGVASQR